VASLPEETDFRAEVAIITPARRPLWTLDFQKWRGWFEIQVAFENSLVTGWHFIQK
jgi:hypothetical protein